MLRNVSEIMLQSVDIYNVSEDIFKDLKKFKTFQIIDMEFNRLMKNNALQSILRNLNTDLQVGSIVDADTVAKKAFTISFTEKNFNINDDKF